MLTDEFQKLSLTEKSSAKKVEAKEDNTFTSEDVIYRYELLFTDVKLTNWVPGGKMMETAVTKLLEAGAKLMYFEGGGNTSSYRGTIEMERCRLALFTLSPISEGLGETLTNRKTYPAEEIGSLSMTLKEQVKAKDMTLDIELWDHHHDQKNRACGCARQIHVPLRPLVGFYKGPCFDLEKSKESDGSYYMHAAHWIHKPANAIAAVSSISPNIRTISLEREGKHWTSLGFGWHSQKK